MSRIAVAEISSAVNGTTTMPPAGRECDRQRLLHEARRILARERLRHALGPALDREAGTVGHRDVRQPEDLVPAVPGREFEKRVGADDQHERLRRAAPGTQLGQRVAGVAGAGAAHFALVHLEARLLPAVASRIIARRCSAATCGAARCGGVPLGTRRTVVEAQRCAELLRQAQVPVVYRVEGAAENADRSG